MIGGLVTNLGVPLHFGGSSVHHGAGEDGHDSGVRVQDSLLHDGVVLLDPNVQRNIVVLGETTQGVEQQNWVLGWANV